ncbi:tetratricopeptide repeat protein [Geothrix sp. 21YS21S-2]|uniref:tetratricopeptide repeat protein n=1 Tax=Geothrix sp. 21YS21S-2 TaxID=3068893 RepID=UPI0027B8F22B|nr:tetratricopeptide repeat protein [Geothrix sp. 21YS21S-2]
MILAPSLLLLLCLQPAPQASADRAAIAARLQTLRAAKDWAAMADLIEALPAPARAELSYAWLEALSKASRWDRLLAVTEELARTGTGPSGHFLVRFKGAALSHLGRHREALEWYREAGKGGDVSAWMEAADEASAIPDWKALLECAEALVDRYPTNGAYLGLRGEALAKLGRFAEAEPVLDEAVHLAPKRAMSWADLACCMNERAAYPEALEAAGRAVALDPRLIEGWCNRGRAQMGLKRYKEGRDDYAAALALGARDPALARNLKMNIEMADKYLAYRAPKPVQGRR